MSDQICAVVLAAGEGQRLRPLTTYRPKALCPINNVPLLDRTLARLEALGLKGPDTVAVNACYLGDQIVAHVGDRAHLSVEPPPPVGPLGTTGGVVHLREWIAGRPALICNADAYLASELPPGPDVAGMLTDWDGTRVRLLVVPGAREGGFSGHRFAGMSLLPWRVIADLDPQAGELVHTAWRPAEARGELELVCYPGVYFDCGTPADYLAANLHASGGQSVIGPGAQVAGRATRCVIWPGAVVGPQEDLVEVIRINDGVTVPASR